MKNSRLLLSAAQGDPLAIASFLGNHLAGFKLWVSATADQRYLDLYIESLEPPEPQVILEPIQQLLCQLKPEAIELVKVSGRKFGETQAQWEQTFQLSEVVPIVGFKLRQNQDTRQAQVKLQRDLSLDPNVPFTDIYALILAVNGILQTQGVAAKIKQINQTLHVELRSLQVPTKTVCLQILQEAFARLDLPEIQEIRVYGFMAKQLTPSWIEELPIQEVLLTAQISNAAKFKSFREEEEFWRPIATGVGAGLVVFFVPLLHFAFRGVTTLIFDGSQAIAYLMMGYFPTLLNSPFQGGGIVTMLGRSPFLIGLIYAFWTYSLYVTRRVPALMVLIAAIAIGHSLLCWTNLTLPFIQISGHLSLWILSFILLYSAFGSQTYRNQGERSLYVVFSVFFSLYNLSLYFQIFRADGSQTNWLAFLGFSITLLIPFLSYKLFTIESLWLPTVQRMLNNFKSTPKSHP